MEDREIIVIRSHGGVFTDNAGNIIGNYMCLKNGDLYNSDFEDLTAYLDNAKLFVFCGCKTAAGDVYDAVVRNLVVQSTEKGVRTAVGFSETIKCNAANTWTKWFFKYLSQGKNVDTAANNAVKKARGDNWFIDSVNTSGIESMRYRGEWDLTF